MKTAVVVAVLLPQAVIIVRGEVAIQPARRKEKTPLYLLAQGSQSRFVRGRAAEVPSGGFHIRKLYGMSRVQGHCRRAPATRGFRAFILERSLSPSNPAPAFLP